MTPSSPPEDGVSGWAGSVVGLRRRVRRIGRLTVGDRTGLVVFLAILVWSVTLWRIGIFLQDTVTVANTLANVAAGRIEITETPYALTFGSQPGLVEIGGKRYGRNYGHVLLSLPVVWLLDGLALLADLRLVVAAGWSLLVAGLARQVATVTGRPRVEPFGVVVGLLGFLANLAVVEPLPAERTELMALQLTTMLTAALLGTTLYRLLARFHGRRLGVVAGLAVVFATPVGLWVTVPKRHVFTASAAVLVLFLFATSREGADSYALWARAGAYAVLGLLTTIHSFEAFYLFVVFAPLDLATAPGNSPRRLAVIAGVFTVALLPLFVLNYAVTGNPLYSPRVLENVNVSVGADLPASDGGGGPSAGNKPTDGTTAGNEPARGTGRDSGSGGGASGGGDDGSLFPGPLSSAVDAVTALLAFALDTLLTGLSTLGDPDRLYHIFLRSGNIPSIPGRTNDYEAIDLTLLESFPLTVALASLPLAGARKLRRGLNHAGLGTPRRQTDLLAASFALVFTLVYLPRLPLHSQLTLRYIVPVFPLLVYGVVRLPMVSLAIEERLRWLVAGYLATVVAGGVAIVSVLLAVDPAIGEAMQFHALVGLSVAALAFVTVQFWPTHRDPRVVAVGLAVPAGATTVFLLLARLEYFHYQLSGLPPGHEPFALDIVRVVAELLPIFAP